MNRMKREMMVKELVRKLRRRHRNLIEQAQRCATLVRLVGAEDACRRLRLKPAQLRARVRLLRLPEEAQTALREGCLTMTAALRLSKLPPQEMQRQIAAAREQKARITVSAAERAVRHLRPQEQSFLPRQLIRRLYDFGEIDPELPESALLAFITGTMSRAEACQRLPWLPDALHRAERDRRGREEVEHG